MLNAQEFQLKDVYSCKMKIMARAAGPGADRLLVSKDLKGGRRGGAQPQDTRAVGVAPPRCKSSKSGSRFQVFLNQKLGQTLWELN